MKTPVGRRQRRGVVAFGAALVGAAFACGTAVDGSGLPEGATELPDGAILLPDGAAIAPDGARVDLPEDDGSTPVPDADGDAHDAAGDGGDDGASDAAADVGPPPRLDPAYAHFGVNHILVTGQSNSIASGGDPALTVGDGCQPFSNVMFNTGVITTIPAAGNNVQPQGELTSLQPLCEGDRFFNGYTLGVETVCSSMANAITMLSRDDYFKGNAQLASHDLLASLHGGSGVIYTDLRKGNPAFTRGMAEVTAGKALAAAAGKTYAVRGVAIIHGESNHFYDEFDKAYCPAGAIGFPATNGGCLKSYGDALIELQADYEAGAKAITGQTVPVPLFVAQMSGWSTDASRSSSKIPIGQLSAHVRAPGKVIVAAPEYILPYRTDGLHFTNQGQRRLAEYFAKAYAETIMGGRPWEPVRPVAVTRTDAVIDVRFHVPSPPLVFDTAAVTNPGSYGFEFTDGSGAPPAIASVALLSADTVRITLAAAPTGPNKRVRYAFTSVPGSNPGPTSGPRGNLRDSDATPSRHGFSLANWALHFDEAVP